MPFALRDRGCITSAASMTAGIAGASYGTARGRSPVSIGRRHRRFRVSLRAVGSFHVLTDAGSVWAMTAIATAAGVMRKYAAMSRIRPLRRCRTLLSHDPAFRHHQQCRHRGVVRQRRIRRIGEECNPRCPAFRCLRSAATNAGRQITDNCRRASAFGINGRLTKPLRAREWMVAPSSIARVQTCNRIGRRRCCHRYRPGNAFPRLRACRSKGHFRSPSVQRRSWVVLRRPRVASSDPP